MMKVALKCDRVPRLRKKLGGTGKHCHSNPCCDT